MKGEKYKNDPVFKWIFFCLGTLAGILIGRLSFVDYFLDNHPYFDIFYLFPIVFGSLLIIAKYTIKKRSEEE